MKAAAINGSKINVLSIGEEGIGNREQGTGNREHRREIFFCN
ncbi:MAG: hypothetical protein ACK6A9_05190 [Dolichospermum sp.]